MSIDYSGLPPHLAEGIKRYVEQGVMPGSFLTAVLANDLASALMRMDWTMDENSLRGLCSWIRHHLPEQAHGNSLRVQAWIGHRGLAGLKETAE